MSRQRRHTLAGAPIGNPEGIIKDVEEAREYLAALSENDPVMTSTLETLMGCIEAEDQRQKSITISRLQTELEDLLSSLADDGEGRTLSYGENSEFNLLDARETRSVIKDILESKSEPDTTPEAGGKTPKRPETTEEKEAFMKKVEAFLGIENKGINEIAKILTRIMKKIEELKELDPQEYHEFIHDHTRVLKALIAVATIRIELSERRPTKQRVTVSHKGVKYEIVD